MSEAATVEINEALFCKEHLREVCGDCGFDGREENDGYYGLDPVENREPLSVPSDVHNKEGVYHCKKHASSECNACFNWKKQIVKLQKDAKKAGKANKKSTNLY